MTEQKIRGIGINLLTSDVEEVAETIKLRLMSHKQTCTVHVGPDGRVYVERASNPRWKTPPPDDWIVGIYRSNCPVAQIKADLAERLAEIRGGMLEGVA